MTSALIAIILRKSWSTVNALIESPNTNKSFNVLMALNQAQYMDVSEIANAHKETARYVELIHHFACNARQTR
jgi:hypothetical protein